MLSSFGVTLSRHTRIDEVCIYLFYFKILSNFDIGIVLWASFFI